MNIIAFIYLFFCWDNCLFSQREYFEGAVPIDVKVLVAFFQ